MFIMLRMIPTLFQSYDSTRFTELKQLFLVKVIKDIKITVKVNRS